MEWFSMISGNGLRCLRILLLLLLFCVLYIPEIYFKVNRDHFISIPKYLSNTLVTQHYITFVVGTDLRNKPCSVNSSGLIRFYQHSSRGLLRCDTM